MGSNAVHCKMSRSTAAKLAAVCLCLLACRDRRRKMEITGSWAARNHEFLTGDGLPVDFTGIPLNEEGRIRALSYSESQLSMVERQCQGWPAFYFVQGPFGLKIWSETDPLKGNVISYTIGALGGQAADDDLDGRPAPPIPICRAHTRRVHHRRVGRQHARHLHNAHARPGFCEKPVRPAAMRRR